MTKEKNIISAEHIIKTIEDKGLQQQFFCGDYWENLEEELDEFDGDEKKYLESIGLPTEYEEVDGRCDTSEFWKVLHFKEEDIYIKITGEYDSYGQYDHYYDKKVKQVFPRTVETIIYK